MRTPQDTRGHGTSPVRDREARGSNPGPPTTFVFKISNFRVSPGHFRWKSGEPDRSDAGDQGCAEPRSAAA
jgi:hypothetical protein